MHSPFVAAVLASVALFGAQAAAAQQPDAIARRIADIASIAVAEYAQGVEHGKVVQPAEYEEARSFLAEARASAEQLSEAVQAAVRPHLETLETGILGLVPAGELRAALAGLRAALEGAVGVALDPLPGAPPSLARGAQLYRRHCAQCHGPTGRGDGVLAAGLDPPPADFTDPALAASSPVEFFRKINVGVAATAMPGFAEQFDLGDRWSLALYASLLRHGSADRRRGATLLAAACAACDLWISDFSETSRLGDDSLAALVGARLGQESVAPDVVAYVRAAAALEELGGDRRVAAARAVDVARRLAREAGALALAGRLADAERRALDGYLAFEAIESAVRARAAGAAASVEHAFADYRAAIAAGRTAELHGRLATVEESLNAALEVATAEASAVVLAGQSFVILVREGLEAILIIGALTAVLAKAGAPERKRDLGWGVLVALALSVLTAVGFATVFHVTAAQQEALEGVTMLLAALVLFWVSYWLVSKIELRKWMAFVRGQIGAALHRESRWALALVAFLAVYREGFETVLFYAALFSSAGGAAGATGAIGAGMAAGAVTLGAVYLGMQRYGVKLPLKPFFAVTSGFLYVMAFSFAGQGVAELQAAGLVSVTPLDWLPAFPLLGVFPTLQTAASQLVLAVALAGALGWVFWLEPRTARQRAS